jgi:LCP family protein required for cell wall assembly
MRYIDLGVSPQTSLDKKINSRKRLALLAISCLSAALVIYAGYVFYWPLSNIFRQIFKNPGVVLSFVRNPSGELKSTDGKTNFLLLGIDKRDNVPYTFIGPSGTQERNGFLSDTIIVLSVDLNTKQASMISIPRDTWISIPGWTNMPPSSGKINSVYSLGDAYNYPGGGLKLTERVVSEYLGIPIHYGVRIDFEGFKKGVDTLNGIDVVVDKTFDDYMYPIEGKENSSCPDGTFDCRYAHVHFNAGLNHMDGETALEYVRSRKGTNGEGSDFARARRQQKVIQAAVKKTLSLGNLLDPVKLNSLFRDFGQAVETDFDLKSLPQIIKLAKEVKTDNMKTFVLDPSSGLMYQPDASSYGGAYVIIPSKGWDEIKIKVNEFLNPPPETKK